MNKFLLVLLILLAIIYIRFHLKFQSEVEILQVRPSQLTPDILAERNPIILEYSNSNIQDILQKSFKYLFLYKITKTYSDDGNIHNNNAKYAILTVTNDADIVEIDIINPKYKSKTDYKAVTIKIQPSYALILPMYWRFKTNGNIQCNYTYDIFSSIYQTLSL
jgi:hypothetical protein